MACGAAGDRFRYPVLRETGGHGGVFAPVGNIEAWVDCIEGFFAAIHRLQVVKLA